jgi:Polycystin cation channel
MLSFLTLDGFVAEIPVLFQSKEKTLNDFAVAWLDSGYIDTQTKAIDVNLAIFNKINLFMASINVTFEFSAAGVIKQKWFSIFSYPVQPFDDKSLIFWNVLYVLFSTYFAIQEALKVSIHIKNALLKGSIVPKKVGLDAGLKAVGALREKIKNVLFGLLEHIKDPWTFLNLLTIILSLYSIITWIQIFTDSVFEDKLLSLEMVDGVIKDITDAKIKTVTEFTVIISAKVGKFIIFIQVLGINSILLTIKLVKYMVEYIPAAKEMSNVIIKILGKIIPFLLLLTCLIFAFSIMITYFLGDIFSDLNSFLKTVFYFFTNLNGNFDYADKIYTFDPNFGFFFHFIFIILINFILGVMFLIYASHVYEDHFKAKVVKTENLEHLGNLEFKPHLLWYLKNRLIYDLKLKYYKKFDKYFYILKSQEDLLELKNERRDMIPFSKFNFDLNIFDSMEEKEKKDKMYINERTKHKIKLVKKQETFHILWSLILSIVLAIFFLVVSLQHQKTVEGRKIVSSVENFFDKRYIQLIDPDTGLKKTVSYEIPVQALQNIYDMLDWLNLFSQFGTYDVYQLSSGENYEGFFFGGTNFLLTEQYRITLRRLNIKYYDAGAYNVLGQLSFPSAFRITDIGPTSSENATNIFGHYTGKWHNYTVENSFLGAGGFEILTPIDKMKEGFMSLAYDSVIDTCFSSVAIDFPIYQLTSKNAIYAYVAFTADDSYNIYYENGIFLIGLDYYNTSFQKFVGFLEVCILIVFFVLSFKLGQTIYANFIKYNKWYYVHVGYFPSVMLKTREKKEPEFLRKSKFVFSFTAIMDFGFLILLFMSIIIWITYLAKRTEILEQIDLFLSKSEDKNQGKLSLLMYEAVKIQNFSRPIESFLIMAILVKIIYILGYFSNFKFLAECLKNAAKNISLLIVILLIYLLGLAIFLRENMGGNWSSFQDIFYIINLLLEMLSGFKPLMKSVFVDDTFYPLNIIAIYIPFMIICFFIISNVFIGSMNKTYRDFQEKKTDDIDGSVDYKEFLLMTIDFFKKKSFKNDIHLEVSDQMIFNQKENMVITIAYP